MDTIHHLFTIALAIASIAGLAAAMAMATTTVRDMSDEEER